MDIREATSTLFNMATKYQDDKAIEAVLLIEKTFTSTNTGNLKLPQCCDDCVLRVLCSPLVERGNDNCLQGIKNVLYY